MSKTIAIDFDGVIHKYSKGWQDGSIYDPPMSGSFNAIKDLMIHHAVFILSSRSPEQIQNWLAEQGLGIPTQIIREMGFWNNQEVVGITNLKLPAIQYIDDRAIKFKRWEYYFVYDYNQPPTKEGE